MERRQEHLGTDISSFPSLETVKKKKLGETTEKLHCSFNTDQIFTNSGPVGQKNLAI